MKNYEEFLISRRNGDLSVQQISHLSGLKTIGSEIEKSERLNDWIRTQGGLLYITSAEEALRLLAEFNSQSTTGIDIETAKLDPMHSQAGLIPQVSRVRLVQLWQVGQPVLVVDCFKAGYGWLGVISRFKLVAHNAIFETKHLTKVMGEVPEITCSMLMLRPFAGRNMSLVHGMAEAGEMVNDVEATEALNIELSKSLQVSNWGRDDLLEEQIQYAAADAIAAALLHDVVAQVYAESDSSYTSANQLLQRLIKPVANQSPIQIDFKTHGEIVQEWMVRLKQSTEALNKAGLFEPTKIKQKQAWIEAMLNSVELLEWEMTPKGGLSTTKETIQKNAAKFPQLQALADFNLYSSYISNFGEKLLEQSVDGVVFPSYRIAGAVTGRFGCSSPNLQNFPKNIRCIFIASPGHKFVTGDLSQIELRVAGLVSGERVINDAYLRGDDLHKLMGAKMAGVDVSEVTKAQRQAAKAANFGLLYGAGARRLQAYAESAYGVKMSYEEAELTKASFHEMYPTLTDWQKEIVADTNARGFSESKYSRLRRHYEFDVYTHAMNFPIQSSALEILALALIYIHARLPEDGSIKVSHHVYDELCLVAKDEWLDEAALLLRDGFKYGFTTVFPDAPFNGLVGIGSGQNWDEAASDESVRHEWSL